ncbi:MAG: hypothetical protein U9R75_07100, partial [Candidatus Thermoplasmatota archaeon]|nr:hypothetical protein [Candidatus Thermoplasmatota archaeon]
DEKGIGISNRTIDIYGFEISISGRPDPVDIFDHGTLIASVNTDENGTCSLPNWQDNISRSILSIVAVFNGSKEFPNGSSGFRYLPDDAYLPSYSHALSMFRKRETRIDLIDPPKRIQKGDGIVVEGYLVDDFLGTGINDREIVIYIHWSREYYIIGRPMTGNDKEGIGFFHLSTSTFPSGIEYGNAELIICFDPLNGNNEDGSHLYCESITGLQIWLETEIKNRFIGAMDVDVPPDGRIDIYEDEIRDIEFIFQVSGRDAAKIEAVTYGLVYFNITLGPYTNSTRALTDIRGKISFNFSYHGELKDSKTGELFRIPEDGNDTMVISLYFIGKKFFCPCSKEILCQFHESIKITSYDNDEEAEKGGSGIAFMVSSAMAVITMIIVAVVIIIRRSKREEHEE